MLNAIRATDGMTNIKVSNGPDMQLHPGPADPYLFEQTKGNINGLGTRRR